MNEERQNSDITYETPKADRKREASSDQQITHKLHVLKRQISEIFGKSDQVISRFSNQGVMTVDFHMNIEATPGKIDLEKSDSKQITSKFHNIGESRSSNQETKKICFGENTSDMCILQTDSDGNVADIEEFKGIRKFSIPDTVTLPSSSCINEHNGHINLNLCAETIEIISPSKLETVENMACNKMEEPAMCSACKQNEMSQHFEIDEEKKLYKCCQCKYSTGNFETFAIHISNHFLNPFNCDACKGFFSDERFHGIKQECDVCGIHFPCKGQLEDHYVSHEDHHKKYCRICHDEIVKHTLKGKERKVYKCCEPSCLFECKYMSDFRNHLYKHSYLKLFKCNTCGRRYSQYSSLWKHSKTPDSCY